jgi:hypothetical protein
VNLTSFGSTEPPQIRELIAVKRIAVPADELLSFHVGVRRERNSSRKEGHRCSPHRLLDIVAYPLFARTTNDSQSYELERVRRAPLELGADAEILEPGANRENCVVRVFTLELCSWDQIVARTTIRRWADLKVFPTADISIVTSLTVVVFSTRHVEVEMLSSRRLPVNFHRDEEELIRLLIRGACSPLVVETPSQLNLIDRIGACSGNRRNRALDRSVVDVSCPPVRIEHDFWSPVEDIGLRPRAHSTDT